MAVCARILVVATIAGSAFATQGDVRLYLGGPEGLRKATRSPTEWPDGRPGAAATSVAKAGDFNGDGYEDVLVGRFGDQVDNGRPAWELGAVHLLLGGPGDS